MSFITSHPHGQRLRRPERQTTFGYDQKLLLRNWNRPDTVECFRKLAYSIQYWEPVIYCHNIHTSSRLWQRQALACRVSWRSDYAAIGRLMPGYTNEFSVRFAGRHVHVGMLIPRQICRVESGSWHFSSVAKVVIRSPLTCKNLQSIKRLNRMNAQILNEMRSHPHIDKDKL